MKEFYPFIFQPIHKDKVWGGSKFNALFGRQTNEGCGESWEIADLPTDKSIIANGSLKGKTLAAVNHAFAKAVLGASIAKRFQGDLPLLFKFIDAQQDLSIQLHPTDEIAQREHNSQGKTEMWYILQADEGAAIYAGFKKEMTAETFEEAINNRTISNFIKKIPVKAGDAFFIDAGLVHSIGAGVLLAEIQQTSDITYRIYDFDRPDTNGSMRELHIDEAKKAIRFDTAIPDLSYRRDQIGAQTLKHSPFFKTDIVRLRKSKHLVSREDCFTVLMIVKGNVRITYQQHELLLAFGSSVLIPAACKTCTIESQDAVFLEVYL